MWLNKLEEKFGKYAISDLPKIIVLLYAVGFVIANISPQLSQFHNFFYIRCY